MTKQAYIPSMSDAAVKAKTGKDWALGARLLESSSALSEGQGQDANRRANQQAGKGIGCGARTSGVEGGACAIGGNARRLIAHRQWPPLAGLAAAIGLIRHDRREILGGHPSLAPDTGLNQYEPIVPRARRHDLGLVQYERRVAHGHG